MKRKSPTLVALTAAGAVMGSALIVAAVPRFELLHTFDVADPTTGASPGGSQPDTRPVIGPDHTVYGMTYTGGANGTGVIYKYVLATGKYSVIHTFGALDASGNNEDGANPGVALTRGPDDVFYGMASFGGSNGNGTVFKIIPSGKFTVLHQFSATDSQGHNEDGANPLRTIVVGQDGNLYGTTRLGGTNGLGVAWVLGKGGAFAVLRQFAATEGHAASLLLARDGFLYGCGVYPKPQLGSGTLYRMDPSGQHFEVLYRFTPVDSNGANKDGADCYEPLVEKERGVFYTTTAYGGSGGNGVVFRYSLSEPSQVEVVHDFSACTGSGAICQNPDGANPQSRLTLGENGAMYATASNGGTSGSGVVFRIRADGDYKVLHTFSPVDPTTGANVDGALPDFGVIHGPHDTLIGMADSGGKGNASYGYGNGTLYQLTLKSEDRD